MSDKPSYLGLLNAISLSESLNYYLLIEWAGVTKDPAVREVLLMLAAREGEHGMTFARRINELGYEVRPRPEDGPDQRLDIIRSDCSDLEKMEKALGPDRSRHHRRLRHLRQLLQGPSITSERASCWAGS